MGYKRIYQEVADLCPADKNFTNNVDPAFLADVAAQHAVGRGPNPDNFVGEEYDYNYLANVGWYSINEQNTGYRIFFSKDNMDQISLTIRQKLKNAGYNMMVTDRVIGGVMSDIISKHTPKIGDIYSIFNIPDDEPRNDVATLNERVINTIVSSIVNEEEVRKANESLNIWDTIYGDFNRRGLRAHSKIRKKERDYMKGQFNLNY